MSGRGLRAALLLAGLAWAASPGIARAQALVADLTSHLVAITTGFTGTSVVLFGATDGVGDVIVTVRGPDRDMAVRRKSKVAQVWVNTREVTFVQAPSFYSMASSRPLDQIAAQAMRQLQQIGLENLRLTAAGTVSPEETAEFREAFLRNQVRAGLYVPVVGQVTFLGSRLFRTTISFPRNVPTGTYRVEVLLVRDKAVVTGQTVPLAISEIGLDAEVHDFADRNALLYGLIAVLLAVVAGWLASLPFRHS
jgi:uncharacterized protein (TIGR02186 family)